MKISTKMFLLVCLLFSSIFPNYSWSQTSEQINRFSDQVISKNITNTESVVLDCSEGISTARFVVTGTWTGTLVFEASVNGSNWTPIGGLPSPQIVPSASTAITSQTSLNGQWITVVSAMNKFRIRGNIITSGMATVYIEASKGVGVSFVLPVSDGVVDASNSTITPLGANSVFTGTATDMLPYTSVRFLIFSDQDSEPTGCSVQFSEDGINWDVTFPFLVLASNPSLDISFGRVSRFIRLVYKNGATPQNAFRVQTIFQRAVDLLPRSQLSGISLQDGNTGLLTRSVVAGKLDTGSYQNIGVSPAGSLNVAGQYNYKNISSIGTTLIKNGIGILHSITVNTNVKSGIATFFDNIVGSGLKIAAIDTSNTPITLFYDIKFTNGLTLVNVGASDITVSFQ